MTAAAFLELSLSVSLQTAVVVAAAYWIGKQSECASFRCRLWTLCYSLLLLLVINAAVLPHCRPMQPLRPGSRPAAAELLTLELNIGRILFILWVTGGLACLGLLIYRSIQADRFLRTCQPVDPDVVSLAALAGQTEGQQATVIDRRPVRLLSTHFVTPPFCWQFHQPCIVIPESLLTYDQDQLKYILRHELAHLRTGHPLQLFLQRVVELLLWFHPMVWWASREWSMAREFQCDDEAIETRGDIVRYLKTLLAIVEQTAAQSRPAPTLTFVRNRCEMAERARRLVRVAQNEPTVLDAAMGSTRQLRCRTTGRLVGLATVFVLAVSVLWIPVNVLASPESNWSPWPSWTAGVLNDFGVKARDFEVYDHRYALHELFDMDPQESEGISHNVPAAQPESREP